MQGRRHYSTCLLADFLPKSSQFSLIDLWVTYDNPLIADSEPTVFENYVHDLYVDDQLVELSLWDTAGTFVLVTAKTNMSLIIPA
jgi:GTPase SAR1 family protein